MRSSVDLPQPDGPRMVMKSLSRDREIGRLERLRRRAAAHAGKTRETPSIDELAHTRLQGNRRRLTALNRKSEIRPITPMTMMPKMICPVVEQRLAVDDHVADAGRGADQLGDDHVGPGPAEHQAQDLGDLRRVRRQQHARDDAAVARAQRVGRLDQIAPRVADRDRHHQHDLEERADEDHQQLLRLADAGPQDQQRDEGRGRQVARERDERLEERLDRLVGAHQHAERHARRRPRARSRRTRARW